MNMIICDRCGRELDFTTYIIAQQGYELCEKCFKKMWEE